MGCSKKEGEAASEDEKKAESGASDPSQASAGTLAVDSSTAGTVVKELKVNLESNGLSTKQSGAIADGASGQLALGGSLVGNLVGGPEEPKLPKVDLERIETLYRKFSDLHVQHKGAPPNVTIEAFTTRIRRCTEDVMKKSGCAAVDFRFSVDDNHNIRLKAKPAR